MLKNGIQQPWAGIAILAIALSLSNCTPDRSREESSPTAAQETEAAPTVPECNLPQAEWQRRFNEAPASLSPLYLDEAVLLSPTLQAYTTPEDRAAYQTQLAATIGKIQTIQSQGCVGVGPELRYELGDLTGADGQRYAFLLIWKKTGELWLREVELIAPAGETPADTATIRAARDQWITLCNQHDANALVTQMYTPDAVYYNHKPLVIGTEALAKEYSYMNCEDYALTLSPILIQPVSDRLVLEIGQCSGSYGGKYVLVWLKNAEGVWQVGFDSNV